MHADYRLLKKRIMEERGNITDQELFTSSAYADYQSGMAETAAKRYLTGIQVFMDWDESENADVAYTNNQTIHENAANPITASFPTRLLKSYSLTGLTGHECGHLLFTDFTALRLYIRSMENGSFYPSDPSVTATQHNLYLKEILQAMSSKNMAVCQTLAKCASILTNICEDIYIEARMCQAFPGIFRLGIHLNNERFSEQIPSIQKQIDKKYQGFSIMANLIIQYCKAGEVNNVTGYQGEYLDCLDTCIPFLDDAMYEVDPRERFKATNEILVLLWPYIKPLVEEAEKAKTPEETQAHQKKMEKDFGNQIGSGAPLPNGSGKPKMKRTGKINANSMKKGKQEAQKVLKDETGRIALQKTTQIAGGTNPGVTYNLNYKGSGYEEAANNILDTLTKIATEKVNIAYEEELSEELQQQAKTLHYGDAHKGIHLYINRISHVEQRLKDAYEQIKNPLLAISKRLQKSVQEVLEKQRNGEKLTHLPYGRRFEPRYLCQDDGAYFSRTRLPGENPELAVALLIDESGSMKDASRITMAQQAAIILHDFCKSLQIPVTIYGHTEQSAVQLYSYVEFDSLDQQDCYRLMDMCARGCNRDGAALRYVAEHLLERPEETKILILISDGQPNGYGYGGTEAEADLRAIKQEYRKKGIILFAAAIGSDKDRIKRIYQDGFLDITDLNRLPKLLPTLISQYIN